MVEQLHYPENIRQADFFKTKVIFFILVSLPVKIVINSQLRGCKVAQNTLLQNFIAHFLRII